MQEPLINFTYLSHWLILHAYRASQDSCILNFNNMLSQARETPLLLHEHHHAVLLGSLGHLQSKKLEEREANEKLSSNKGLLDLES